MSDTEVLTVDMEVFATERRDLLEQTDESLRATVKEGLESRDWAAVIALAGAIWADQYTSQTGREIAEDLLESFTDVLEASLKLTTTVPADQEETQLNRVVSWISVFTINDAANAGIGTLGLSRRWVTMLDDDVRETHRDVHGEVRPLGETFTVGGVQFHYPGEPVGSPELYMNCVLGSTQVEWTGQDVVNATRRMYDGPVVHLRTVRGHVLSVTPNHPILTTSGYVKAGQLRPGDYLLASEGAIAPEVDDVPPSIEQVFSTLREAGIQERVVGGAMDFHGDGAMTEVQVVWADRDLSGPHRAKEGDLNLVGMDEGEVTLAAPSESGIAASPSAELEPSGPSPSGFIGSTGELSSLGDAEPSHPQEISLATSPNGEVHLPQASIDNKSINPQVVGYGENTVAPEVAAPQIVKADVATPANGEIDPELSAGPPDDTFANADFTSHFASAVALGMTPCQIIEVKVDTATHAVYNLQTSSGYYIANGITVHNCRCVLQPVIPDVTAAVESPPMEDEMVEEDENIDDSFGPIPWHGVLAPIGKHTGDGRMFAEGSITHRDLPLPMKWQKSEEAGHGGSVVVATIQNISEEDGLIWADGFFIDSPEANEVLGLIAEGAVRGVSVDLDATESVFETEEGERWEESFYDDESKKQVMKVTKGRISAATIVPIPAFAEAYIEIGTREEAMAASCIPCADRSIAASTFAPGTRDGPGWLSNPRATQRLRNFWVRGEGALKVRWNTPGDFNRCRRQLVKYIKNPDWLAGTCANLHKEATGRWPGRHTHSAATLAVRSGSLLAAAGPALESAGVERIGLGKVVSISTDGTSPQTTAKILRPGDRLQVLGIHAGSVSAEVVEVQSFRNGSIITLKGEDVSAGAMPSTIAVPVSSSGPHKTSAVTSEEVIELHLGPEFRISGFEKPSVVALAKSLSEATIDAVSRMGLTAGGYILHTNYYTPQIPKEGTSMSETSVTAAINFVETEEAIVASSHQLPRSWFDNPELSGPTPVTITEDGRIYGHIASWNTCHTGIADRCVMAPRSSANYAHFRTGAVMTDDGEVAVGHITMGIGHAPLSAGARPAAEHYDNTDAVVADIACGEDDYGIWFSGALRPEVSEERIRSLRAAALSGDWRTIGGGLELIATLAVNVPGFPVPRIGLAASGLRDTALVACGVIDREEVQNAEIETIVEMAINKYRESERTESKKTEIREKLRAERLVAARQKLGEV